MSVRCLTVSRIRMRHVSPFGVSTSRCSGVSLITRAPRGKRRLPKAGAPGRSAMGGEPSAYTRGESWRWEQLRDLALVSGWCAEVFARWKGRLPSISRSLEKVFGKKRDTSGGEARVRRALSALARRSGRGSRNAIRGDGA